MLSVKLEIFSQQKKKKKDFIIVFTNQANKAPGSIKMLLNKIQLTADQGQAVSIWVETQ